MNMERYINSKSGTCEFGEVAAGSRGTPPDGRGLDRRAFLGGAVGLGAALTLVGCASGPGAQAPIGKGPTGKGSVTVFLGGTPTVLSPLAGSVGFADLMMELIFDTLVGYDPSFGYQPRLAQSYEISSDAKTYTFHLRPGMRWSDGVPFSSEDVLYTFTLLADPRTTSASASNFASVLGVDAFTSGKAKTIAGFTAPDPNTFVVQLVEPDLGWLATTEIFEGYILPKHVLGKIPADQVAKNSFFVAPTVSCGPFTIVDYKVDQYFQMKRNPGYWNPARLKTLYVSLGDPTVALTALGAGTIDLVQITPETYKAAAKLNGVKVVSAPGGGPRVIFFNCAESRFADTRVRQAFLYAIDRQAIINSIENKRARISNSVFMTPWAIPDGLATYPYNPSEAKKLLQEAGWDSSKTVTLVTTADDPADQLDTCYAVQAYLQAVGVKCVVSNVDASVVDDDLNSGKWDLVITTFSNNVSDPGVVSPYLNDAGFYPNGANLGHFRNAELTSLMDKGNGTSSPTERADYFKQVTKIENEQVPILPLYVADALFGVRDTFKGFVPTGVAYYYFSNASDWYVD